MTKKRFFQESELVFAPLSTKPKFHNLTGKSFGRLKIIGYLGILNRRSHWYCKCECGNINRFAASDLMSGKTLSCGCFQKGIAKKLFTKHGHSRQRRVTTLYRRWLHMMERCSNPKCNKYEHYGGRGIKVCQRWHDYENFLADMGNVPKGLTLERNDVNENYCPENCRWATMKEQANNRRNNHLITFEGETKTIAQWSEETGISAPALLRRISKLGWGIKKALTTPVQKRNKL